MQGGRWLWPLLLVAGCGQARAPQPDDDTLVLELGAADHTLRDSLIAVGALSSEPAAAPVASPPSRGATPPAPPAAPPQEPPAVAPPPTVPRSVPLEAGMTISELAARHLGTAARYREILELNGWSEDQARRLRTGTAVKLPER